MSLWYALHSLTRPWGWVFSLTFTKRTTEDLYAVLCALPAVLKLISK